MVSKASFGAAVCAVSSLLLFNACSSSSGNTAISYVVLPDSDADGLPDALEATLGSDPADPDSPTVNGASDVDGTHGPGPDALSDALEQYLFSTGATPPITAQTDSDFDGLPDYLEIASGFDHLNHNVPLENGENDFDQSQSSGPVDDITDALEAYLAGFGSAFPVTEASDADGDGFTDYLETRVGTNPFNASSPRFHTAFDVDRDGLPDHLELVIQDGDPLSPNFPFSNGDEDADGGVLGPDGDSLTDGAERYLSQLGAATPVTSLTDTDFDGVPDYVELLAGSDFLDGDDPVVNGGADTGANGPADSISDALEVTLIRGGASAPITESTDSDGDGFPDFAEVTGGTNAFSTASPVLFQQFDLDGDGVPDVLEIARLSDPLDSNDPVQNGGLDENNQLGPPDDRISDAMEFVVAQVVSGGAVTTFDDTDADGISDYIEVLLGSDPLDVNSPVSNGDEDTTPGTGPPDDGISDAVEAVLIALGSSAPVDGTNNSDQDIIPDFIELLIGSNPVDGFDPSPLQIADLDGDEAPDYFELLYGADPLDPASPMDMGARDDDGDGLSNALEALLEIAIGGDMPPEQTPESDEDLDGLANYLEALAASDLLDPTSPAPSGGSPKGNDTNDATGPAGDGVSDALELYLSFGGASIPVTPDNDTDGDFLKDVLEVSVVTDPFDATSPFADPNSDNDGDGVQDALEFVIGQLGVMGEIDAGTDTDLDGAPDYLEVQTSDDIFDDASPVANGGNDSDDDGLSDALEAVLGELVGGEFTSPTDTDLDGIPDYFEVRTASNPLLADHPLLNGGADVNNNTGPVDTISDALEDLLIRLGVISGAITQSTDTDFDGTADYLEVLAATDAFDPVSPVENGRGDPDRDRIRNSTEVVLIRLGAESPVGLMSDTDGDGAPDYVEVLTALNPVNGNDPVPEGNGANRDSNDLTGPGGDVISDALELILVRQGAKPPVGTPTDTDNDGIPDYFEVSIGSNPFEPGLPIPNGDDDTDNGTGPAGDGISDGLESIILFFAFTNGTPMPEVTTETDIDMDGVPDYIEVYLGTNLLDAKDLPPNGSPPEAFSPNIEGDLAEGETVTGQYVYFDINNDFEGASSFRWLRGPNQDPIDGAVKSTYTLTADDIGMELTFEVTPVSLYAWPLDTLAGDPATATVTVPSPGIAISVGGPGGVGRTTPTDGGNGDLTLWLQADHGVTSDNDGVQSWRDRSASFAHATPAQVPPLLVTQDAATTLRFRGEDELVLARPVSGEFTLFAAFQNASDVTGSILGSAPKVGEFADLRFGLSEGRPELTVLDRTLPADGLTGDGLHAVTGVISVDSLELFVDGASAGSLDCTAVGELTPSRLTIGSDRFQGEIGEVVLFDRVLAPLERRLVEHYLAGRYGIALERPLYDGFETHPFELCGLGREGEHAQARAHSTGDLILSDPSSLDEGDYLFVGANRANTYLSEETPSGVAARLAQSWAYTQTNSVGTLDLTFLLGSDSPVQSAAQLVLLVDDDGDFSDAHIRASASRYDVHRATAHFEDIELSESGFFALGLFPGTH